MLGRYSLSGRILRFKVGYVPIDSRLLENHRVTFPQISVLCVVYLPNELLRRRRDGLVAALTGVEGPTGAYDCRRRMYLEMLELRRHMVALV